MRWNREASPERASVFFVPTCLNNAAGTGPTALPVARLLALDVLSCAPIYHPYRWYQDGEMADNVFEFRPKPGDTEKITINLGYIDLGHIDLLVQEGFYSNRTDFIRTAIRNQIERHADTTKQSVARKSVELGLRHYSRKDLEAAQAARATARHSRAGAG